ncbi:hypothetical protein BCR33DRAFT_862889 [Rhizoclosmatium globosum]|uniref:Uncharacterized protein n=1 Tax=Rhizoclosmatium globosum TaxID=329046 RepID=A0A1Y2ACV4_9FUNG|nr:hypothetical protein BCR33DRAFT_862889 [Rhizoclosmatium globosum]|eukprot:ORY20378.1 hypothetical protein BCR33DRAFT_862889 [Rhizoclosmatium globosum]
MKIVAILAAVASLVAAADVAYVAPAPVAPYVPAVNTPPAVVVPSVPTCTGTPAAVVPPANNNPYVAPTPAATPAGKTTPPAVVVPSVPTCTGTPANVVPVVTPPANNNPYVAPTPASKTTPPANNNPYVAPTPAGNNPYTPAQTPAGNNPYVAPTPAGKTTPPAVVVPSAPTCTGTPANNVPVTTPPANNNPYVAPTPAGKTTPPKAGLSALLLSGYATSPADSSSVVKVGNSPSNFGLSMRRDDCNDGYSAHVNDFCGELDSGCFVLCYPELYCDDNKCREILANPPPCEQSLQDQAKVYNDCGEIVRSNSLGGDCMLVCDAGFDCVQRKCKEIPVVPTTFSSSTLSTGTSISTIEPTTMTSEATSESVAQTSSEPTSTANSFTTSYVVPTAVTSKTVQTQFEPSSTYTGKQKVTTESTQSIERATPSQVVVPPVPVTCQD